MAGPADAAGVPGPARGSAATGKRWLGPAWIAFLVLALVVVLGLTGLGVWQLQRMGWKRALIAAVEQRAHLDPVAAPGPDTWAEVAAHPDDFIYRRVALRGHWLVDQDSFVQATTDLGAGYWLLSPLSRDDGSLVLVNRGFVSRREAVPLPVQAKGQSGEVAIVGLLRQSEPTGSFPRRNDPAADRWYNRSLGQIAERRGLGTVAPFFVDAQAIDGAGVVPAGAEPVVGLTMIQFRDHHLGYALTWFTLALMTVAAVLRVLRWHLRDVGGAGAAPADATDTAGATNATHATDATNRTAAATPPGTDRG